LGISSLYPKLERNVIFLKKWLFSLFVTCLMLAPTSVLAESNTSSSLIIDPAVTDFSDFSVSPAMNTLSGNITLNGNVPDAENKMRPVYKFKLENTTSTTVSGLTAYIPYPPGTTLDTTYPPEVLITETNQNRNKEDIIASYDTTTGIHLKIPDMEPGEILTFDVKFFLLPVEEEESDLNKVTLTNDYKAEWLDDQLKVKLILLLNNANKVNMEKVTLKVKLPEGISCNEAMISGIEGATVTVKDGYMYIYLPSLKLGQSNVTLTFMCSGLEKMETVDLPLMLGMDGFTDITLAPLHLQLKGMAIDWKKILIDGAFTAKMKDEKLWLNYLLTINNQNEMAIQNYKLKLLLPDTVSVEDLKISGLEGAGIEVDEQGVVWITIPSLEAGTSNLNISLMGMFSGTADELTTGIVPAGASGVTASLRTNVTGISSTDSDAPDVVTDTETINNASANTLPKTGSPFGPATWSMLGVLFVLLGIGIYYKGARMQA
jgi:hypothetical protein